MSESGSGPAAQFAIIAEVEDACGYRRTGICRAGIRPTHKRPFGKPFPPPNSGHSFIELDAEPDQRSQS